MMIENLCSISDPIAYQIKAIALKDHKDLLVWLRTITNIKKDIVLQVSDLKMTKYDEIVHHLLNS